MLYNFRTWCIYHNTSEYGQAEILMSPLYKSELFRFVTFGLYQPCNVSIMPNNALFAYGMGHFTDGRALHSGIIYVLPIIGSHVLVVNKLTP